MHSHANDGHQGRRFRDFCSCNGVYPATGPAALDIDTLEGGVDGMTSYQVYVTLENAGDFLSAVTGDATNPTFIRTSTAFHQDPLGSANAHGINAMVIDAFPELAYDSWVTVGLTSTADAAAGEGEVTLVEGEPWIAAFEAGGNLELGGDYGGGWFSLNGADNGLAGDDLRVLIGQFTTDGVFSGQVSFRFPNGDGDNMQFQTRWASRSAVASWRRPATTIRPRPTPTTRTACSPKTSSVRTTWTARARA